MIERFLFNGVNAKPAGTTIAGQYNFPFVATTHKAQTLLAFMQFAIARTDIALNPAIIEGMPMAGRKEIDSDFSVDSG
jgi:hypothetical protein